MVSSMSGMNRENPRRIDGASFRRRAGEALLREPPSRAVMTSDGPSDGASDASPRHGPSDYDLDPEMFRELAAGARLRPAAVLVPVVLRAEPMVLFTVRSPDLPAHAGQISFPGGKVEERDGSPLETALREAEEEVGLDRRLAEPLGYLDCYRTGTGYEIFPVVAAVDPAFAARPDPREVAEAFEAPLAFLLDSANHRIHSRVLAGRARRFHAMPFGNRFIWGATAGIVKNMYARFSPT